MDIHKVYRPFLSYFRRKRIQLFYSFFNINARTEIIDIGGDLFFWKIVEKEKMVLPKITIVNVSRPKFKLPNYIKWVVADGRCLPFDNYVFDIAFCNSVIEHLGDYKSQLKCSEEIRRVALNYFVETPDKAFFIEPHLITPFIHWLPSNLQKALIRNFTLWGLITRPSLEDCMKYYINGIRLLSKKEMAQLFPDGKLYVEHFLGFSKTMISYKRRAILTR
ncbi:MAG: class I SAM-dependent methyltransferase [Candidatus Omnitrophica bacterium]|nr:class I SAM-dependent methyltransferase [Candidatus Omnitrophota bacterium]